MDVVRKGATAHVIDGLICKGYIAGLRYVHGPIEFRYKAIPPEAREMFFRVLESKESEPEKKLFQDQFITSAIRSWNQQFCEGHEKAGEDLPIDVEHFQQLESNVRNRISNIIFRSSESDLDPNDTVEEQQATLESSDKTAEELLAEMQSDHSDQVGN